MNYDPIIIFLGIAAAIVALAVLLTRSFRKSIKRDERISDPNGDLRDGNATATWIGIEEGDDHH
ncbi:MAG: hypothetical protein AAF423_13500 [Pseudomonadota bacterium]